MLRIPKKYIHFDPILQMLLIEVPKNPYYRLDLDPGPAVALEYKAKLDLFIHNTIFLGLVRAPGRQRRGFTDMFFCVWNGENVNFRGWIKPDQVLHFIDDNDLRALVPGYPRKFLSANAEDVIDNIDTWITLHDS